MRLLLPLLLCIAFLSCALPVCAAPPEVSLGYAVVDGSYTADWDLTADYFANMYRAGDPAKQLESKLYLKYDCPSATMYVLVLDEPDVVGYIVPAATTSWIAIDSHTNKVVNELTGSDGTPPDFAWIGRGYDGDPSHVRGYEASFPLLGGATYTLIAHTEVFDATGQTSATIGFPKDGVLVVPNCTITAARTTTWGAMKALYR